MGNSVIVEYLHWNERWKERMETVTLPLKSHTNNLKARSPVMEEEEKRKGPDLGEVASARPGMSSGAATRETVL